MSLWDFSKVGKGLLRQTLYIQSQWMDFKNLSGVWKPKRFCISCIETIFRFLSQWVWFSAWIFFNFDFQMYKTHLKSFVFKILFIGDNSSTLYFFDGKVWSVLLF